MTTNSRAWLTQPCRGYTRRIASWNITSWQGKDQDIITELKKHKVDICALSETKMRGSGLYKYCNYILIYSGEKKNKRTNSGVGIVIHEKYEDLLRDISYISDRILRVILNVNNSCFHIFSIYIPSVSRPQHEIIDFFNMLQQEVDQIPTSDKIIILGDMNARIGKEVIYAVKHRFNEKTINSIGEILIEFCLYNGLRINNTFFPHKWQSTWSITRHQQGIIDYILTNKNIQPNRIIDVKVISSENYRFDHRLVLSKMLLCLPKKRPGEAPATEKIIESLDKTSTQDLYRNRSRNKL